MSVLRETYEDVMKFLSVIKFGRNSAGTPVHEYVNESADVTFTLIADRISKKCCCLFVVTLTSLSHDFF